MRKRMMWCAAPAVLVVGAYMVAPVPTLAQGTKSLSPQVLEEVRWQAALAEVERNRADVTTEIAVRFARDADQGELQAWLALATAEQLLQAREAQNADELNRIAFGRYVGEETRDLVFTPIPPCRIADTRFAGGKLAPFSPRGFDVTGRSDFTFQGGDASCPRLSTLIEPAAVVATLTVADLNGGGNLRAWAFQGPAPTSSVINYLVETTANTTVIPMLQSLFTDNEISVQADYNGTHVIIDVVGYMARPVSGASLVTTELAFQTVPNNGTIDVTATCPSGRVVVGGGFRESALPAGMAWWASQPVGNTGWRCWGANTAGPGQTASITCYARCISAPQ